jgi:DNA topoisomerase-1
MKLVIVESPTKAKTLNKFLGRGYTVLASYGHIADLPKSELAVDVGNNYAPKYVLTKRGSVSMQSIEKAAKSVKGIYLAPDPDREGEAIAFSIAKRLENTKSKIHRVTFHEITDNAVKKAFDNPGEINTHLVEAQQARRVLDRLVGYKLSPLLWTKIRYGLSAGRVQSVAVRLIVERQEKIDSFKPDEYWTIEADFKHDKAVLRAALSRRLPPTAAPERSDGGPACQRLALAGRRGKLPEIPTGQIAVAICQEIKAVPSWRIAGIREKIQKRYPYPPFKTSTLQQAASASFGWSAKKTAGTAQRLYEQGFITYIRTDSTNLSSQFLKSAQDYLGKLGLSLTKPRIFKTKAKLAQEAHEAIRPTDVSKEPDKLSLDGDIAKLYRLIWERSLASQAKPAEILVKTIVIEGGEFQFKVTGSTIRKKGWFNLLSRSQKLDGEIIIPSGLKEGDLVDLKKVFPNQHFTKPPAYFNEASLIKKLEQLGVGRPSTYAVILHTIVARGYVERDGRKLTPTDSAKVVTKFLKDYFANIVDYDFTADMEGDLDKIAEGSLGWVKIVDDFYKPFVKRIKKGEKTIKKSDIVNIEKLKRKCPECGSGLVVKLGKRKKFVSCSNYPTCKYAERILTEKEKKEETTLDHSQVKDPCPECKGELRIKDGPFGKFIGCRNYPKCKFTKPYLDRIGVECPDCKKGDVVKRVGKGKRVFYSCSRYPKCKFITNKRPSPSQ